ncbi:hypothetical protein A2781_06490 [Candidatus Gottesmanbacteria bacterium RIFCSPHIGHO2_01_FULL_42_27]|uniref:Clp R domain-containing protein n=2 Tax=Candidatus Gottesmaniibacteriota TaxID=1752720 RepID=A0A1F6BK20_9BACT|nr:MAG: clp protease ATP binding subunit [Candidatus Gottesmanbacteria bacterium GW2011_GWA2_42_18]OGG10810.1 MAG: hypothetical protein A2781_06490 [Candidatus Gottesmanbacteria bacterium RIFCSPHIGHO2_01_FULL_42_27]OGG21385.1 MAG: hypothetical protein A3E72_00020 [Candidatus Gottesmanbacteria bacterium RIFCSPHIGHO2_12_FULL_43_26]OGG37286.1 MAG: hypothetical protein A2968_00390 [Candidatus Gottesmanbacteria bacterium RIFCSPLOWO2_01_FULL_42_22]
MDDYLYWHYGIILSRLLTYVVNSVYFAFYFCAIPHHLSHLLSPWKRIQTRRGRGFQLAEVFSVASFNLTSRIIGLFLRLSVIIFGLTMMLVLPLIYIPPVLIWALVPFLTYPLYLIRHKKFAEETAGFKKTATAFALLKTFCLSKIGRFTLGRSGLNPLSISGQIPQNEDEVAGNLPDEDLYNLIYSELSLIQAFSLKKVSREDFFECLNWYKQLEKLAEKPLMEDLDRIRTLSGVGMDWSYGYTVELDKYSRDLTAEPSPFPFLLGREAEIKKLERALLKSSNNNVLIIGEPGIARHMLIETLARNLSSGKCDRRLFLKRIIKIDMHTLCSGEKNLADIKAIFSDIYLEAQSAGNIILFIDEIDKYISEGSGRLNLTDVFEKFARGRMGFIGLTTTEDYHRFLEKNATLTGMFEEIFIYPPDIKTVIRELEISIVPMLEEKHHTLVSYSAIKKTVENAERYLTSSPFPAKAIELMENSIIASEKKNFITAEDIDSYLSQKLKIPLGNFKSGEKEKLTNLEDILHLRIINQHSAIRQLSGALRRARLNVSSESKPIGSFLFLGPTGVGKTETAKALAESYFGGQDRMQRFDMSQYQGEEGLSRLLGHNASQQAGELTEKLTENPFTLILFDEIEKAPKEIQHLFLTLLDEGYIHDASGKKIDCRQTIIIATSNAGSEFIRETLQSGQYTQNNLQDKVVEFILREKIFSPEFINRFDAAIVFTPLSQGNLREIAKLQLNSLNRRLAHKEIRVRPTDELINFLASSGASREFGARAMRRTIETSLEDYLAKKLLDGSFKEGNEITIDPGKFTAS